MYRFAEVTHIFKILGFYRIAAIRILMVFHKDNFFVYPLQYSEFIRSIAIFNKTNSKNKKLLKIKLSLNQAALFPC